MTVLTVSVRVADRLSPPRGLVGSAWRTGLRGGPVRVAYWFGTRRGGCVAGRTGGSDVSGSAPSSTYKSGSTQYTVLRPLERSARRMQRSSSQEMASITAVRPKQVRSHRRSIDGQQ